MNLMMMRKKRKKTCKYCLTKLDEDEEELFGDKCNECFTKYQE